MRGRRRPASRPSGAPATRAASAAFGVTRRRPAPARRRAGAGPTPPAPPAARPARRARRGSRPSSRGRSRPPARRRPSGSPPAPRPAAGRAPATGPPRSSRATEWSPDRACRFLTAVPPVGRQPHQPHPPGQQRAQPVRALVVVDRRDEHHLARRWRRPRAARGQRGTARALAALDVLDHRHRGVRGEPVTPSRPGRRRAARRRRPPGGALTRRPPAASSARRRRFGQHRRVERRAHQVQRDQVALLHVRGPRRVDADGVVRGRGQRVRRRAGHRQHGDAALAGPPRGGHAAFGMRPDVDMQHQHVAGPAVRLTCRANSSSAGSR